MKLTNQCTRILHRIAAIGIVFLVLGGCASVGKGLSKKPIKIAVASDQTGFDDNIGTGIAVHQAVELLTDSINDSGGLLGRTVELLNYDSKCDAVTARRVAKEIVDEGAVAVIGHSCSGATLAAMGIYEDNNIFIISPQSSHQSLTDSDRYKNFFRTMTPDNKQADLLADFAVETLGATAVALIHDEFVYSSNMISLIASRLESNYGSVDVVLTEELAFGLSNYSSTVDNIIAAGADAVLYGGYYYDVGILLNDLRGRGSFIPFIASDGVHEDEFFSSIEPNTAEVYVSDLIEEFSDPGIQLLNDEYRNRYGEEPTKWFYTAYAASQAVIEAIAQTESTSSEDISRWLHSNTIDTVLGPIRFDESGNITGGSSGFIMYSISGDKWVAYDDVD